MKKHNSTSTMDFADWVILLHVNISVLALLTLAFVHPTAAIVGAVCGAIPVMLGTYHFFFVRDQKIPDAVIAAAAAAVSAASPPAQNS